ncbi:MAG: hypothetical protein JO026_01120 [Patescibacteria group bacterium]|nr:hypothetical protein [Patescibacteria group bacterium]
MQAYLTNPDAKTDADKYGQSLVFYYTKDAFIKERLYSSTDRNSVSAFTMHDMKTGKEISECVILPPAGLYKDSDLLLSVSYVDTGTAMKDGVCLYQRSDPNFRFIDLTSKLTANETLFNDPAGRDLKATITNVDTARKTFDVAVYDMTKKSADSSYAYKRSITVAY